MSASATVLCYTTLSPYLGYVMMTHYHIEHILTLLTCHNYWEDSITQQSRQRQGLQAPPVAMPLPW